MTRMYFRKTSAAFANIFLKFYTLQFVTGVVLVLSEFPGFPKKENILDFVEDYNMCSIILIDVLKALSSQKYLVLEILKIYKFYRVAV